MKDLINDFDIWQDALKKINLNESALPIYHGHILSENAKTYEQIQKILNAPELEGAHRYCLDLDPEALEENEITKVNNLYKLGVERGFIEDEPEEELPVDDFTSNKMPEKPVVQQPQAYVAPKFKVRVPSFTIMYSAMKDGQIKTGEAYSNAISPAAAKADVYAKLSKIGYSNISILAIECGDPDSCGFEDEYTQEDDILNNATEQMTTAEQCDDCSDELDETESMDEDDILKNRAHNGHVSVNEGVDAKTTFDINRPTNELVDDILREDEDEEKDGIKEEKPEEDKKSEEKEAPAKEENKEEDKSDDSKDDEDKKDEKSDDEVENKDDEQLTDDDLDAMMDDALSDDSTDEKQDEDKEEDVEDKEEKTDDSEDKEEDDSADKEDKEEDKEEEDKEEKTDDSNEDKEELTDDEKSALKDEYTTTFKNTMVKCEFVDKSFNDLTIEEKVKFFTELSKAWTKNEPSEFMTDKQEDQLENIVIEK